MEPSPTAIKDRALRSVLDSSKALTQLFRPLAPGSWLTAPVLLTSAFCLLSSAAAQPPLERLIGLAETGTCKGPLPSLRKATAAPIADPALKRRLGTAAVRCSMSINDPSSADAFLIWLSREFPHDLAVLYLASHVYSYLSLRASNELLSTAPGSIEVHQLNAEALETMGKWKEAEAEYRAILRQSPSASGIHYRLGRLLLSATEPPPT